MKVSGLHGLDLSPPEARRLQEELASRVVAGPALDLAGVRHVAGADVSTQGDMAYATVVVLDFPGLSPVEVQGFEAPLRFPYVPGLLSFRELPSVVGALEKVETEVDALILDAQGIAHPRRMGLASHLGIFLDVPTVGCAKSLLVGSFEEPGREKGSATDLVHRGEVVGQGLRTQGRGLSRLRFGGERYRPGEFRGARSGLLYEVQVARDHTAGARRGQQAQARGGARRVRAVGLAPARKE